MDKKQVMSDAFSFSTKGKILSGLEWGILSIITMKVAGILMHRVHENLSLSAATIVVFVFEALVGGSGGLGMYVPKLFPPNKNDIERYIAHEKITLENKIKLIQNNELYNKKQLEEFATIQLADW